MTLVCPYCRTEVDAAQEGAMRCESCQTPHHVECYSENGGCTVFGCKSAPPDDPKILVGAMEVSAAAGATVAAPVAQRATFGDVNAMTYSISSVAPPPPPPPPPSAGPTVREAHDVQEYTSAGIPIAQGVDSQEWREGQPLPFASGLFNATAEPAKARLKFILLGIFLGAFGVHNFYAGYTKRGIAQLCLTICTLFYGSFVSWIWAVVEVCTVDRDSRNVSFI